MIDKIHRALFLVSATWLCTFALLFILELLFFGDYNAYPSFANIAGVIYGLTPFMPIGTLFGTLKKGQTTRKKITILLLTGISMIVLFILTWGIWFAEELGNDFNNSQILRTNHYQSWT